jgi:hypothetical protein
MPYRLSKVFVIEKSAFRSAKALTGATPYRTQFPSYESRDRTVEVVFQTSGLDDDDARSSFARLEAYTRDFLGRFTRSTCVSKADPELAEVQRSYVRLVLMDGEPTAALLAKTIFERVAAMIARGRFVSLAGRVRVVRVRVQDDDREFSEYVED